MAQVKTLSLAGKSVNVPHVEHRIAGDVTDHEKNVVTFGIDGTAEVSQVLADALVEFYPFDVEIVPYVKPVRPKSNDA